MATQATGHLAVGPPGFGPILIGAKVGDGLAQRGNNVDQASTQGLVPAPTTDDEGLLRGSWAGLPDLCLLIGPDRRYQGVNAADHPLLARPWPELRGQSIDAVNPRRLARETQAACQRAAATGQPQPLNYRLRLPGAGLRSFEAVISKQSDGWLCVARDVTARVQLERQRTEPQARQLRAMRGAADGLWEWDLLGGDEYLSPRGYELLGYPPEAGDTARFFELLHPDDHGSVRAALQSHAQHGAPFDVELRLLSAYGDYRWLRCRGISERNRQGRPVRVSGTLSDITVRKQTEEALRDSQSRFSAMFHTVPVGIALLELKGGVVLEANDELAGLLGWSTPEMVGRDGGSLGLWQTDAQRLSLFSPLARSNADDWLMHHRRGRTVRGRLSAQRVLLAGDEKLLCAITDVTDWRAAEEALGEQRDAYGAIFNATRDAIVSIDHRGRIQLFNPGAERIFGRDAAQVLGWRADRLLAPGTRPRLSAWLRPDDGATPAQALPTDRLQGLHADGRILDLEASLSLTRIKGRQVLTAILRDVSERVQAEALALQHRQQLSALTEQLMTQERVTTQRLAQALHDQVGQTLTALRLTIERQARRRPDDDGQASALVDAALREIRQVLVDLRPPLLEDEGLLAALDNELATRRALHPGVALLLSAPAAVQTQRWPVPVEYALFMIAREAIDNALRHAAPQQVSVSLAGGPGALTLTVRDDGSGLAAQGQRARPGHLGLIGMRERARAIGAEFSLRPHAAGGTLLRLHWAAPA